MSAAAPRPHEARLGMTRVGSGRDRYNAEIEGRPSRFIAGPDGYLWNPAYTAWTERADAWAEAVAA